MSFFAKLGGSDTESSGSETDEESILSGDEGAEQDRQIAAGKKPKYKASMFEKTGSDDESEDEESESDDDSDEEEMSEADSEAGRQALANRFLKGASSDEASDGEDKTIVMSAKDKRFAEMEASIHNIQNATKNADGSRNDWVLASSEMDKLLRFIARHQTSMLSSPIPPSGHIPPAFLRCLVELNQSVNSTITAEKNAAKKMAPVKAKALNGLKQALKKKAKEFEAVLKTYDEDPATYTSLYESANATPAPAKAPRRTALGTADGQLDGEDFTTIGRGGRALQFTADGVFRALKEIVEQRGRKNTDRAETIKILQRLLEVSATTYQKIRVYLALIPARLDYSQNLTSMPHDSWVSCMHEFDNFIQLLLDEPDYIVQEQTEDYDDMVDREPETKDGEVQRVRIAGGLVGILENLDNEFTKTLQNTDAHDKGSEYIERLREEVPLYVALVKAQVLFEREALSDQVARAVMRRLEHIYAKPDSIVDHFESAVSKACSAMQSQVTPLSTSRPVSDLVHDLCVYVYSSEAPLLRARAILIHIFNHAVHARFHQARDLLLMSHMQESIANADVTTQILYNRAIMQLGLAAFRCGFIPECQTILSEMFSTQRQKELLAQAIQRYGTQLTPEQELIEKRRLLPFHMHLNIELLEAAYLTSCMLIEIPLFASVDSDEQRRRFASKTFKRLLDMADRQAFMGPPENTRDHVIKASKALQAGDWERARELLLTIKVWTLLENAEDVKAILSKKIQEEGLRTYLFTYSANYASLSLDHLATTFSLPKSTITSIISRMIYTDELAASLDPIEDVVVFHRVEQTEVQRLAQQLAERAVHMVEQNEKTLDVKLGASQGQDRAAGAGAEGQGRTGERRGGRGGSYRGRGRGRGFQSGLGGAMGQRRVAA